MKFVLVIASIAAIAFASPLSQVVVGDGTEVAYLPVDLGVSGTKPKP